MTRSTRFESRKHSNGRERQRSWTLLLPTPQTSTLGRAGCGPGPIGQPLESLGEGAGAGEDGDGGRLENWCFFFLMAFKASSTLQILGNISVFGVWPISINFTRNTSIDWYYFGLQDSQDKTANTRKSEISLFQVVFGENTLHFDTCTWAQCWDFPRNITCLE